MKENKSWAFALKAIPKNEAEGTEALGYIVFPDEKQAFNYLTFSNQIQDEKITSKQTTKYEAHTWVQLDEIEADMLEDKDWLFVDKVNPLSNSQIAEIVALAE